MTYLSRRCCEIREEEERRKAGWSVWQLRVDILPKDTPRTVPQFDPRLLELGRRMGPVGVPYPFTWRGRGG